MVPRCGFYADGDTLVRKTVYIDWSLGFDREAKHAYGNMLIELLSDHGPVAEVTSGSPTYATRQLSPMFVIMKGMDKSVEDYLKELSSLIPNLFAREHLLHFFYLQNLSEKNLKVMHNYNCYTDMFWNPTKGGLGNSQATSLAVYRVLENIQRLDLLQDEAAFREWFNASMKVRLVE